MTETVGRSLKVLAIGRFAVQLITWAMTLVIIRLLNAEDYALMALVGMVLGLLALINDAGLSAAIVQRKEISSDVERKIFGLITSVNLALFLLVYITHSFVEAFFAKPGLGVLLFVSSFQLLLNPIITYTDATLRREMRFEKKARIEFGAGVSGAIVSLVSALAGLGVWSLVYGMLSVFILKAILGLIAVKRVPVPQFSIRGLDGALGFSGFVTLEKFAWYTANQSDIFIAGKYLSTTALGAYSVAFQLVSLPLQKLASIINDVGLSGFSRVQNDEEAFLSGYLRATRLVGFFAFPVFIGIGIVAPLLTDVLLGEKWALAGQLMGFMCLAFPFKMLNTVSNNALLGRGHSKHLAGLGVLGLILLPGSYFAGLQLGGITGLAAAVPIAAIVQFTIGLIVVSRVIKLPVVKYIQQIWQPILFCLLMAFTAMGVGVGVVSNEILVPLTTNTLIQNLILLTIQIGSGGLVFSSLTYFFAKDVLAMLLNIARS